MRIGTFPIDDLREVVFTTIYNNNLASRLKTLILKAKNLTRFSDSPRFHQGAISWDSLETILKVWRLVRIGILPIDDLREVHFTSTYDANLAFTFKKSHLES